MERVGSGVVRHCALVSAALWSPSRAGDRGGWGVRLRGVGWTRRGRGALICATASTVDALAASCPAPSAGQCTLHARTVPYAGCCPPAGPTSVAWYVAVADSGTTSERPMIMINDFSPCTQRFYMRLPSIFCAITFTASLQY